MASIDETSYDERVFLGGRFTGKDLFDIGYTADDMKDLCHFQQFHEEILRIFEEFNIDLELIQLRFELTSPDFTCKIEDNTISWTYIPALHMSENGHMYPYSGWIVDINHEDWANKDNLHFFWDNDTTAFHKPETEQAKKLIEHKEQVFHDIRMILADKTITLK